MDITHDHAILPSVARTADVIVPFKLGRGKSCCLYLDVTAVSGTNPTLDIDIEAKDPVSGKVFALKSFAQATGVTTEAVWLGLPADTVFPTPYMRANVTIGGTDTPTFTFSLSGVPVVEA
jgi:hypothetical protein